MRILIDIGHPAHVHLFRNFASEMIGKGHKVLFTCRDKEFEINLLKGYGFSFVSFGRKYKSIPGKIWGMIKFDIREYLEGLRFRPDILLSHGSIYAAHASFLLRKPHICFEDTFNFEQIRLYKPFSKHILTSNDYEHPYISDAVEHYNGFHELAYLHPNRFSPCTSIFQELGIDENEKYVILRLVSWHASHDIGHKGISKDNVMKAICEFSKHARVFISSESQLPVELEKYKLKISPQKIHSAIAFASLVFGESSTMSEEAAMLGVPSVYLYNKSTIYTLHLEQKYQLMFNYSESVSDQQKAIEKGSEILQTEDIKALWKIRRDNMLNGKIDVTTFLIDYIDKITHISFKHLDEQDRNL